MSTAANKPKLEKMSASIVTILERIINQMGKSRLSPASVKSFGEMIEQMIKTKHELTIKRSVSGGGRNGKKSYGANRKNKKNNKNKKKE